MTTETMRRSLGWKYGTVCVESMGGMLGPSVFALPGGQQVSPFYLAPWHDEPERSSLDNLTAALRGEWPCVPFGYPMPVAGFPAAWQAVMAEGEAVNDVHGYSANNHWTFGAAGPDKISLFIDYPESHPVKRLVRTITPDPASPALNITLEVEAREACSQPIALHACFRLPGQPGMAEIRPAALTRGWTHPAVVEPHGHIFKSDRVFTDLRAVPGTDNQPVNASRIPFSEPAEELLQLEGTTGKVTLLNLAEKYGVALTWDEQTLPGLLLWYSNYGQKQFPWNGRNLCIGLEPVCSPFGLSALTACQNNPMANTGTPTAVALSPDKPLLINYRIEVGSL
ncbi:hypothetical protein NF212_19600 [Parasalinivibrio latis]|uniref:hypothetical protein n=1 Tax=Parasalinivibrio latis TaxID=2952610 RepID=UPI0030DFCF65